MTVLSIKFDDFKTLSGNHRVYYYEGIDYFDFHFLVDGNIVKSTIYKDVIDDRERFFSDKMFYGAISLDFRVPVEAENPFEFKVDPKETKLPILAYQDEEVLPNNENIQKEGVEN